MLHSSDNVRMLLTKLVPSSIVSDISSFSYYDNHPRDETKLDIVVGTSRGEIKEFYQRELISSTFISAKATDIRLVRDHNCELYYLATAKDELIILSRNGGLRVLHRLENVEKYELEDSACSGQVCLKIVRKDDAVPLLFDVNFETLNEQSVTQNCLNLNADDCLPIVRQLMRKLTEAKYTVHCNEKAYNDLLKLRQRASFAAYNTTGQLSTKLHVKLCNNKIVILLDIPQCEVTIQDVCMLLHGTTRPSITYTTKLYERTTEAPYWKEITSQSLKKDSSYAIAGIVDLEELKYSISSRLEFKGVISYKINDVEQFQTFEKVSLSALDTMSCEFNALSEISETNSDENKLKMLSVMATTHNIELCLRHVESSTGDTDLNVLDVFCKHLQMERVMNTNIVVHRHTPFHTLHGVMLLAKKNKFGSGVWNISVYARNPAQVLALINYIYDAIPYRIIITTTAQRVSAKDCSLNEYNEGLPNNNTTNVNYTEYASSILNQTSSMLNYLDNCMIKMNESKNPSVLNKVGTAIDPYAAGVDSFKEFRRKVLEEATRGVCTLEKSNGNMQEEEGMIVDSD